MTFTNMPGAFWTFEGIDGSGKSTQMARAAEYVEREYGIRIIMTKEPGGTPFAEALRSAFLDLKNDIDEVSELLALNAARRDHCMKVIRPATKGGKLIWSDRFVDSTKAYQSFGRGYLIELVEDLHSRFINTAPDLTFLFDLPVRDAMGRRANGTRDRMDSQREDFYERVRNGYLQMAGMEPDRFRIIDASLDETTVQKLLCAEIDRYFAQHPDVLTRLKKTD